MLKVAKEFPNVKFEHATGYKRADNMAHMACDCIKHDMCRVLLQAMMTKTNKFVMLLHIPIPEVIREINTYYMGAKKMNPDVDI